MNTFPKTPSKSHDFWVTEKNCALLLDLYELTMAQAYWKEQMNEEAVFSLYFRKLPAQRNYMLAAGLAEALDFLHNLKFTSQSLEYLSRFDMFQPGFLDWLGNLRFEGDVYALPEGTPVFPDEPLLEVVAPIAQAQLAETFILNQVHFQTVLASKASRVVSAASGKTVVDFGLRRMHGTDAGLKSARAFHIAGVQATSNVLAGQLYGMPVTGTMAHSYVQAHSDERAAFRAFAALYPDTVLLVDTYDTLKGVDKVIELARELGENFRVRAIRLDSGDLAQLAWDARSRLDQADLMQVQILASGGLDEYSIEEMLRQDAPVDGFGVGTRMGVSADSPTIDMAYKLTAYGQEGRLKLSAGKKIYPGRKQVFRIEENGVSVRDILAGAAEDVPGRPLLERVMEKGCPLPQPSLQECRDRAQAELAKLPPILRNLGKVSPSYPVEISQGLRDYQAQVIDELREGQELPHSSNGQL